MGEVDRHDVKAWRAGSSKRSMRFPGAAVHEGGKESGEFSLVMSFDARSEFFLDSTLVKFSGDSFRLPENFTVVAVWLKFRQ